MHTRHFLIAIALACFTACSPSEPTSREPEPASHVIASGRCLVPICYQLDLKESNFRIYAPNRASPYRYIPKGACTCSTIKDDPSFFGAATSMTFETENGERIDNVAIGRAKDKSDINLRTTYERFLSERDKFEEVSDFGWRAFDFSEYRVYREREARGAKGDTRRYYFIPKEPRHIVRGSSMRIAFNTPLGKSFNDDPEQLSVATNVRLSDGIFYFQFLNPRMTPPAQWPATVEKTIGLIETRMFPK